MRLLHFDSLDRLISEDFSGKPIPPYAILSHRWSDSEALFEDISLSGRYKEKKEGYQKLRFCAKQAARDQLQYFWVDTCCIDKWNNRERSMAINSMFKWYSNAARCYVFLSDVSVASATEASQRSSWEALFRGSDWFKRGWTLQEMIAPVSVEFFSREGQRIGDKASLDQLLHDRTGIPLAALRNCPLDQFSTSERMRWAENRTTTEEEDIVYCLLGVLDVSMPTPYREGKESALRRLHAELEGVGSSAPSIIPFSRNKLFVGRESQLAKLQASLFSNEQTTTTLAVVGPGGTGKSQLALEAAYRTRLDDKDCSVFWMDASDTDSLYQSYASVAQKLSIPGCDDGQADIKQVVKRCMAELSARRCLLIFDNAEGIAAQRSDSSTEAADLVEFLPHSKLCSVVFTTTESDILKAIAPQNVIALDELTPDTALRMLQSRLTTPLSETKQQEAMHLLRELLYLPLAVAQAAACMNASNMTAQQYRAQLNEHKEAALKYSSNSSEGEQQEPGLRNTVAATVSLSIGQVQQGNAVAAKYLYFAACVDRKDISLDLLEAASPQAREDAVKILDRYALIIRRPAESALDVHQLVHHALREQLQVQERLQEWNQHAITQLLQVFPNSDHSNRSKWRRLLPHAQCALSHSGKNDNEERSNLAENCAMALSSDGQDKGAEELHMQVMETRRIVLGREHPSTLASMNNLAGVLVLDRQGKYEEAEVMHRQTLATREMVLGREHPDTLTSVYCLAHLLAKQYDYEESLALYDRACDGLSVILGDHHPTTRGCRQHRTKAIALQEQSQVVSSPAAPDKGVSDQELKT
ncbi:HET-domain-containing protein [Didymella exigua CBS 183.55]|uniref:HET-domain-containing protein n=1 Tax=Didymella exigua CBS 183.55 TaxID=1150837 RepID=A0A6A5RV24_9PLEO|nr:HET-domain-containing protein [Didymella exigua CBS 183.55]KAF1931353.1 HET-domain-containing protein [Didymella exigua CBS 183.55]